MAVGGGFDQWRKDVFFSAAEEVQESTDIMESVYRRWKRNRTDGLRLDASDEMRRELHIALGTAKWQFEEFERAVNLSHENCSPEEDMITRRKQFLAVIGNQISRVEKELNDSFFEDGKQPLRWVQLDEEERDDLAVFLSAAPQKSQEAKDKRPARDRDIVQVSTKPKSSEGFKETITIHKDVRYLVEVAAKEPSGSKVVLADQGEQLHNQRRTSSSPDIGAWKIVIADEGNGDRQGVEARSNVPNHASSLSSFIRGVDSTARSKWFRNSFPKEKKGEHRQSRRGLSNYLNLKRVTQGIHGLNEKGRNCFSSEKEGSKVSSVQQLAGKVAGVQRQVQFSQYYMQYGRSLRATLLLVLTIFLVVPFVLYST